MVHQPPPIVAAFFASMQAGPTEAVGLIALFAEDGVYTEPFSGTVTEHLGRDAIKAAFQQGWENPLPDMRITVDRVHVKDGEVTAAWTCHSPALPGGSGTGVNTFTIANGQIQRLDTRLT